MKKMLGLLSLFLLVAVSAFASEPEKLQMNLDQEKLEAGKLQIFVEKFAVEGEGAKKRVVGVQVIDAPPAVVWSVLADWESMPDFVPGLKYYKTLQVTENQDLDGASSHLIAGAIRILFLTVKYSMDVEFDQAHGYQRWRLVSKEKAEGYQKQNLDAHKPSFGLKDVSGFQYIEPYADGLKTLYVYAPVIESSIPVPSAIERFATKRTLRGYIKGLKKTAEKRNEEEPAYHVSAD